MLKNIFDSNVTLDQEKNSMSSQSGKGGLGGETSSHMYIYPKEHGLFILGAIHAGGESIASYSSGLLTTKAINVRS